MKEPPFNRRAHPSGASFSFWQAGDGWQIRRMDWPQPIGVAVRGSLLFAGGRGDFIEKYLEPLAHWHGLGWSICSFDWRGQGDSRGGIKGGHLDSFDPLVRDGSDLMRQWAGGGPGPRVAIGQSMGGHLLLRILAEQDTALSAAVLIAPMMGINTNPAPVWAGEALAQSMSLVGMGRIPAWSENEEKSFAGSTRQRFLTSCEERYSDELWWLQQQPDFALGAPSWGWLNAAYRSMASLTAEAIGSVDLPVLLVATEQDRLVSADAIRRAAELLPRSELLMFPDAAHEILRERDAIRLQALARIEAFLESHARR